MNILILLGAVFALMYVIALHQFAFRSLALASALFLAIFTLAGGFSFFWGLLFWSAFLVPAVLLGIPSLRQQLVSQPLLRRIRKILPPMSETERDAIEAGSVWWEAELFRGAPGLAGPAELQLAGIERARAGLYRWPGGTALCDDR